MATHHGPDPAQPGTLPGEFAPLGEFKNLNAKSVAVPSVEAQANAAIAQYGGITKATLVTDITAHGPVTLPKGTDDVPTHASA